MAFALNKSRPVIARITAIAKRSVRSFSEKHGAGGGGSGSYRRALPIFADANSRWMQSIGLGGMAVLGLYAYNIYSKPAFAEESEFLEPPVNKKLPTYRKADVAKHKTAKTGIWVSYRHGVYDVTEFVKHHPGGTQRIMLAAGGSIEPFWHLYPQHKTTDVLAILEEHRIGNLDPRDIDVKQEFLKNDPYRNDPVRHPAMRPNSIKPYCAEPTPKLLGDAFYTPNELHYVRNHHPVPVIDPKKWKLELSIDSVRGTKTLSLDDLKTKFKPMEVSCALQCAGNRRTSFNRIRMTSLAQYDTSAISCAKWTGARLRDVLLYAGIPEDYEKAGIKYIVFEALDVDPASGLPFQVSVPVEKVMDPHGDSMLCYKMNGEDLPPDHGFPVRALHPGFVGFRNCKWVGKIRASKTELPFDDAPWQHSFYKVTPPRPDIPTFDFKRIEQIYAWPVQSIFCSPMDGDTIEEGTEEIDLVGVAWSGMGRGIHRVDISTDGGKMWHQAELEHVDQPFLRKWAWTRWTASVPLPKGLKPGDKVELRVKAVDDQYNNQPEHIEEIWNLRGCFNNSQHRIQVTVE